MFSERQCHNHVAGTRGAYLTARSKSHSAPIPSMRQLDRSVHTCILTAPGEPASELVLQSPRIRWSLHCSRRRNRRTIMHLGETKWTPLPLGVWTRPRATDPLSAPNRSRSNDYRCHRDHPTGCYRVETRPECQRRCRGCSS